MRMGLPTKFEFNWISGLPAIVQQLQQHDRQIDKAIHIDGLEQERRNSIANALELRLSCTNPTKSPSSSFGGWQKKVRECLTYLLVLRQLVQVHPHSCNNNNWDMSAYIKAVLKFCGDCQWGFSL